MPDFKTVMEAYHQMKDVTIPAENEFVRNGLEALQIHNQTRRGELNRKGQGNGSSSTVQKSTPSSSIPSSVANETYFSNEHQPNILDDSLSDDHTAAESLAKRPQPEVITRSQGAKDIHHSSSRGRHPSNHHNENIEAEPESDIEPNPAQKPASKAKSAPKALQLLKKRPQQLGASVRLEPVVPAKRTISETEETNTSTKKGKTGWEGLLAAFWAKTATGDVKFSDWSENMKKGVVEALCNTSADEDEIGGLFGWAWKERARARGANPRAPEHV